MAVLNLFLALASLLSVTWSASTFSPARPPAIPLAVRSPYLSTWQFAGSDGGSNGGYLAGQWPTFWEGQVTGWAGIIRVDGVPYVWMGAPTFGSGTSVAQVNQTSFEYTSTQSIFHQNVDNKVGLVVTFLSPVTPTDYVRQSLVSSYLDVQVYSLDGNTHDVQIYTDISAEWVSGDRSAIAQWDYGVADNSSVTPSTTGIGSDYPTATSSMPTTLAMTYSGNTAAVTRTVITFGKASTLTTVPAVTKRDAASTQPIVWVTDIITQYVTTCPIGHTLTTSGSTTVLTAPTAITTAVTSHITSTASGTSVTSEARSSGSSSASPASVSSVSPSPISTGVVSSGSASSLPVPVTAPGSVSSSVASAGVSTSGGSSSVSSASSRSSSVSGSASSSVSSSRSSASVASSGSSSSASSASSRASGVSTSGSSSSATSASSRASGVSTSGSSSSATSASSRASSVSTSGSSSAVSSVSSRSSSASVSASSSVSASASGAVQTNGIAYHRVYRQTQLAFSEVQDQTEYGYWYYMTANTTNLSYQSGQDVVVRDAFATNGVLPDTKDTNYRAINNDYPVFGFAIDLGSVGSQSKSALWTINLNQEDAVQFEGYSGNQTLPSLWTGYFDTDLHANTFFYNDYSTSYGLATTFDNKIVTDSVAAGGSNYSIITQLSVRQAFGALQLTNTPETPYLFLKEISSDGNIQTVDVIFPFHPIAIYTNPDLIKLMLEPLFINQEAGYWPFAFSIHDLGTHYPNATGHNDGNDEQQPLEECGNMIIMALAYAQRTGDDAWLASHYEILRQWNEYLVQEALIPANQISTDDFAGSLANQTNLAIKGIIGIEAMAQIANRTGHGADGANYTMIAHNYISQWQTLAIDTGANPPHTTLSYGNDSSWGLLYNLYADRELGLQLVPQSVYDMQSAFYPTEALTYGVPLDSRHTYTKSDWEMFTAAIASEGTKELFIDDLAKWINETPTQMPFTDLYDAITGDYPDAIVFAARPVVGGEFALLALNGAPTSGYVPVAGS